MAQFSLPSIAFRTPHSPVRWGLTSKCPLSFGNSLIEGVGTRKSEFVREPSPYIHQAARAGSFLVMLSLREITKVECNNNALWWPTAASPLHPDVLMSSGTRPTSERDRRSVQEGSITRRTPLLPGMVRATC